VPTNVALLLCAGLAVIAVPLALRWIGPNRLYGFRTRATLSDRELWYSANAFGGWSLLISAILGAALVILRPAWFDFGVFTNLAAIVGPTIVATLATFFYIRNR
jgi:hypothetical protein